jgi:capsular polysaccharide biosynthesis protein
MKIIKNLIKVVKTPLRFTKKYVYSLLNSLHNLSIKLNNKNKLANNVDKLDFINIQDRLPKTISLHKDVISYPLKQISNHEKRPSGELFSGGLINSKTHTLIENAIHYNGLYHCQEIPEDYEFKKTTRHYIQINKTVLYGGILYNHFGHFLAESLGRLYAYKYVREADPGIMFYAPWGIPSYLDKSNYVNQVLSGFNIPLNKLIFVDKITKIKSILVSNQIYGFGYMENVDLEFLNFMRTFKYDYKISKKFKNSSKIYVSRSKQKGKAGKSIGENLFEAYLTLNGYIIFYPEQHDLSEQLSIYSNADKIIFLDGSAVLACILLPDIRADIAIIARRRDTKRSIRAAIDCFSGYGKTMLWIDCVTGQYHFGAESWEALAEIDWLKVSNMLKENSFVDVILEDFEQNNFSNLAKTEIKEYIQEISKNPSFINFMMNLKEQIPIWDKPSHLRDPR